MSGINEIIWRTFRMYVLKKANYNHLDMHTVKMDVMIDCKERLVHCTSQL